MKFNMNTAIIMLGSNTDAILNMELAIHKLLDCYQITGKSMVIITEPFGDHCMSNFHNLAIKLMSTESIEDTKAAFKKIEQLIGRKPESKSSGIIPIDIDLIFWNDILVHDDYIRYDYVKKCVNDIK